MSLPPTLSHDGAGAWPEREREVLAASWPGPCRASPSPVRARHPLPRLGRVAVRGQRTLLDPADLPGTRRHRHRQRHRAATRSSGRSRGPLRRQHALRGRGPVLDHAGGSAGQRPHRRGLPHREKGDRRRRLEDQPGRRRPIRSSWRSTGWPGPSCRASRSTQVSAGFHYVRTGETVLPEDLPGPRCLRGIAGEHQPALDQLIRFDPF